MTRPRNPPVKSPPKRSSRGWLISLLCALGFLGALDYARIQRVNWVSRTGVDEAPLADPASPTGYAQGKRWLIVPEHNNPTYQWIQETQVMLARGDWRVRQIDYENAPSGREVHSASPYRWWLVGVAWCDHVLTGRSLPLSVEKAALWCDPLLHVLLLIGGTVFAARRFGSQAASLLAFGLVALYPVSASFLPGVLSDYNLSVVCAVWSGLFLVSGLAADRESSRWFFSAGIAAGCGVWVSVASMLPVIGGVALGGFAKAIARATEKNPPRLRLPWRLWGLGGASVSLLAYLVEYFPHGMDLRLEVNHPLYAVAWIGIAELLTLAETWAERRKFSGNWREAATLALALCALLALPATMAWKHTSPPPDLFAAQLTNEPDAVVAGNLARAVAQPTSKLALTATLLPVLLLISAGWLAFRDPLTTASRAIVIFTLGAAGVSLAVACMHLRAWSMTNAIILTIVALLPGVVPRGRRWLFSSVVGVAILFGAIRVTSVVGSFKEGKFTRHEIEQVYERALSHWLADRAGPGGALVMAPPFRTPSLSFYGGLRGLGTQNWENRLGLAATVRIASSVHGEAQAILTERGVTHIVLPSWDKDLDEFARLALADPKSSFVYQLTHWTVFESIRPLPYRLPGIAGLPEPTVAVLELTEPAGRAAAISRITEYFVEMELVDVAGHGSQTLRQYPADLGALIAIAQVEKARNDADAFAKAVNAVVSNLASGSDRFLPWNRRVNLAVVLTLGGRKDLARPQVERCWKEMDAEKLRSLTTGELYRLLVLGKANGLQISDPRVSDLVRLLLPSDLRQRL
ncbi:MAG: hypothetical protein ABIO94_03425 [Opitutaceae bacterium]